MKKDIFGLVGVAVAMVLLGVWAVFGKTPKLTEPVESEALEAASVIQEEETTPNKDIVRTGAETVQAETTGGVIYELETLTERTISETEIYAEETVTEATAVQETVGLTEPSGEDFDISEYDRVPEKPKTVISDTEQDTPESAPVETVEETEEETTEEMTEDTTEDTTEETTEPVIQYETIHFIPELQA